MQKQIEKFSNEPVAYYLHKKRNFLEKLHKRKEPNCDEQINRIRMDIKNLIAKEQRDLYIQMHNIKVTGAHNEPDESEWRGFDAMKFMREQQKQKNAKKSPFVKKDEPRITTIDVEDQRSGGIIRTMGSVHKRNSMEALRLPKQSILPLTQRNDTPEPFD